ncbi:MAG: hypothetical protein AAGM22_10115, partial [Acidobacteriota bacterium]
MKSSESGPLAALDVGYFTASAEGAPAMSDGGADFAVAAAVTFSASDDERPASETRVRIAPVAPYEPGQFFRRELPCLLKVLAALPEAPRTIV